MGKTEKKNGLKFMPPCYIYRRVGNLFQFWSNTKFGPWVSSDTMDADHFRSLPDATEDEIKKAGVKVDGEA